MRQFPIVLTLLSVSLLSATALPNEPKLKGTKVGEERDDNGLKLKLVWCPPGKFKMGSPESEKERDNDEVQVAVTLSSGYWLGKYEVTQSQHEQVIGKNPSYFSSAGLGKAEVSGEKTAQFPVETVSYDDALEFCRKFTESERAASRLPAGWEYALPTEAQWEYACRAGTTTPFSFGSSLNGSEANVNGNSPYGTNKKGKYLERTTTVGSYPANKWGLHDMHGNVWEWCRDWHTEKLPGGTDPEVVKGMYPVTRGSSWFNLASTCRSAYREKNAPGDRFSNLGFRLALSSTR